MKGYLTRDQKIAILNELGVYDKWKDNVINLKSELHMNYVLSDKCRFSSFINQSFSWSKTKEGIDFWRKKEQEIEKIENLEENQYDQRRKN